ncbi:MAG: transposase family protein [Firmicutes bacterium]|nr:transposase family protein [Bacillota bacterium]
MDSNPNTGSESMSRTSISTIHNFISKLHLPIYVCRPVNQHITDFIAVQTQRGIRGKITDLVKLNFAPCHLSPFGSRKDTLSQIYILGYLHKPKREFHYLRF